MLESEIQRRSKEKNNDTALLLDISTPGMLNTLAVVETAAPVSELGEEEIEIDAKAWGLNFRVS